MIVAKPFQSAFTGGDPKSKSRQKLAEPVDSNPDVVGLRDRLTIPEPKFIEFSQKGLAAFLGDLSIMREKVAAVEIPPCEHAGHALNRGEIKITIAVNDADLGAHDLEEPSDGVKWRSAVPH